MSLYKYRTIDSVHTKGIFKNRELYFSAPRDFNDPFDCKLRAVVTNRDMFANKIAEQQRLYEEDSVRSKISTNEYINENLSQAVDNVINKKGVCCFSRRNDCILMWSHYADSHRGICIEFDVAEDDEFFSWLVEVQYQEKYPSLDLSMQRMRDYTHTLLSTKFSDWGYEEEVRVYKDCNGCYKFKEKALKAVYFGCNIKDGDLNDWIDYIKGEGFEDISFYKAKTSAEEYRLLFEKL